MAILNVLTDQIARTLFEPLAIIVLCMVVLAFPYWKKQKNEELFFYFICILFAILWRCAIQIVSSRYAVLLLFPVLTILVWFCFSIGDLYCVLLRWRKWLSYGGVILFIVIAGLCVGKLARVNPYNNHSQYCAEALTNDARQYGHYLWYTDLMEAKRNQYFVGTSYEAIINSEGRVLDEVILARIQQLLQRKVYYGYPIYLFLSEKVADPFLTAELLSLPKNSFSIITWQYEDRRHRNRQTVYRFLPDNSPCFRVWDGQLPAANQKLKNGDFEQALDSGQWKSKQESFSQKDLYFPAATQWPAMWNITAEQWKDDIPEITLTEHAIEGKSSLFIHDRSSDKNTKVYSTEFIPVNDGVLHFLARTTDDVTFGVFFHIYGKNKQYLQFRYISYFYLPADVVYEFYVPVQVSDNPGAVDMLPGFIVNDGSLVIDCVAFEPRIP